MKTSEEAIQELGSAFTQFKTDHNDRLDELEKKLARPGYKDNKGKNPYSLKDAILHLSNPQKYDGGKVREVSQDLETKTGLSAGNGLLVPISAFTKSTTSFGGDGSNLVETEIRDFVDVLRNNSVIMGLGRTLMNLTDNVSIPKKTASSTAYWIDGDGSSITESGITLSNLPLEPHFVAGLTKYSYRMLLQSDPGIEQIISDDLLSTIGVEIDRAAIQGSDASNQPKGILEYANIGSVDFASTDGPTFAEVVEMEQELADNNALRGNLAYLSNSGLLTHLKTTEKATDTAEFIHANGIMNGYNSLFTGNVPTGKILFGNFDELVIGMWGAIRLAVDPYSDFDTGTTSVRAIAAIDFTVRHDESFAAGEVASP